MTGVERLQKLAEGQEDTGLLKIVNYLSSREDLDNNYLDEEKSLKDMTEYINDKAKKQLKNKDGYIADEKVYEWAVNYFSFSNEELGFKKKFTHTSPTTKEKEVVPEKEIHGQLTLF